jgi:HKD family nuclease
MTISVHDDLRDRALEKLVVSSLQLASVRYDGRRLVATPREMDDSICSTPWAWRVVLSVDHNRAMTGESHAAIPGDDAATAMDAIARIISGARRLRAAVAFVTSSGVDLLDELLEGHEGISIELVARGAPITDPHSLERLAERGLSVSVVVGSRASAFHPKLWIADHDDALHVLSGSGNLTAGGLRDNDEQFELVRVPLGGAAADAQEQRFARITAAAVPLDVVRRSPYWSLWKQQQSQRRTLALSQQRLDKVLQDAADARLAVDVLYSDLVDLYERTKSEVEILAPGGGVRRYVASYFKRAIDQSRETTGPVPVVARMVKSPTDGYGHLAAADRPDLMVETLVIDASKPYHRLFLPETVAHAQANLDAYHASKAGEDLGTG